MSEASFKIIIIVFLIPILFCVSFVGLLSWDNQTKINLIKEDTAFLKNNDFIMADYIKANSRTLEYLKNNCKIVEDNDFSTTLVCVKGVEGGLNEK